jgi:hexosaminidase
MTAAFDDISILPRPRCAAPKHGFFVPCSRTLIRLQGDTIAGLFPVSKRLREDIKETWRIPCPISASDIPVASSSEITLRLDRSEKSRIPPQGYLLSISPESILLVSADEAGAFYGVMTLVQILRQCEHRVPCAEISDSPDFPVRGVMLDVSRDKVPSLQTLASLIDMLSEIKINQLQFYTEHTFAYSRHREVWAEAGPITGEEILTLDRYCRDRHIELVPNQNSFGHLNRWLTLPRYRHLAECPDGFEWPEGGRSRHPFSLDPLNPESITFLEGLYDELLPNFTSRFFNVGCDETWDLGQGRSAEACRARGKGRIYMDFLLKIHDLVTSRGRTMMFWGDIIMQHPEFVRELPRDCMALEWGYEADHPFAEHSARFAASGIPFYVCPGTSSWNSIAGRTNNCLANLRSAAENGLENGASGFLNTDWGDWGHWQYLPVSFLGYAAGAAFSWCHSSTEVSDLLHGLDLHIFKDRSGIMGRLAHDLGNVYLGEGLPVYNGSFLFHLLLDPARRVLPKELTASTLEKTKAAIVSAAAGLEQARMARPDADAIHDEFANTVRLLLHAVDRGGAILTGTADAPETRTRQASDLRLIIGEYSRLWMLRNRAGGLQDSMSGLMELLKATGEAFPSAHYSQM